MARFEYLNVNPEGLSEPDCVCRAITYATGLPYETVQEKLWLTSKLLECNNTCVVCYKYLIEDVFGFKPMAIEEGLYPADFADIYPEGLYIIRMNGHLSICDNNYIIDSFDSRYYGFITDAWKVE